MPVRKVKLKDGSIGYQWGTTGKIYKKREDAEKQGIAILLSQRKKRKMKITRQTYNEALATVERLERLFNGGEGSGFFGHVGRPGKKGGSAPSSVESLAGGRMEKGIRETDFEKGFDGGFTIDLKTAKSYRLGKSDGYAVGGFGTEGIVSLEDWKDPVKRKKFKSDYIKKNRKVLDKEGMCLGGWVPTSGPLKGKVVLDVSKVFTNKRDAAVQAIKTDQDSITDFRNIDWPSKEDLAKEFGLEKELAKSKGLRAKERNA